MKLKCLDVTSYRGIKNCTIENLQKINIFLGDNNSGKTSFLELLHFLKVPQDINYIKSVVSERSIMQIDYRNEDSYTDLVNMFPKNGDYRLINIEYLFENDYFINYIIDGDEKEFSETRNDLISQKIIKNKELSGIIDIYSNIDELKDVNGNTNFKIKKIDYLNQTINNQLFNTKFISTYDHLKSKLLNNIVGNKQYKDMVVERLKKYDSEIVDLRIITDENTNDYTECIENINGYAPISTYGDGIKKMIGIANSVLEAENGILLIDEIETSLHYSIMKDVFDFLIHICYDLNIQLFITTHNIEAIDNLLDVYNDKDAVYLADMSVVTIVKKENKTIARTLSGIEAKRDRENFGLELR